MYNMTQKYARLAKASGGTGNPYIDPEAYVEELDARERVFNLRVQAQKKAAGL
jgi:hypothetical protein